MEYEIEITETLSRIIRVKADSEDEAHKKVRKDYIEGKIVLDSNDYVNTKFSTAIIEEKRAKINS